MKNHKDCSGNSKQKKVQVPNNTYTNVLVKTVTLVMSVIELIEKFQNVYSAIEYIIKIINN
jgi:hypothetical protein